VHALTTNEMPSHSHTLNASTKDGTKGDPTGAFFGGTGGTNLYASSRNVIGINEGTVIRTGASQPHENRQPFLVITCIVSLSGIFPKRN